MTPKTTVPPKTTEPLVSALAFCGVAPARVLPLFTRETDSLRRGIWGYGVRVLGRYADHHLWTQGNARQSGRFPWRKGDVRAANGGLAAASSHRLALGVPPLTPRHRGP